MALLKNIQFSNNSSDFVFATEKICEYCLAFVEKGLGRSTVDYPFLLQENFNILRIRKILPLNN